MSIELVTVKTTDGIELDGALYHPVQENAGRKISILMIHGLTWNFYRGPSRWLPPLLSSAGFPCLSLNMRDHDQSEPKDFELSHYDLRAGIDYLKRQWNGEIVLLAHGYASNKVVCYPALSGDKRILLHILTTLGAVKAYRPDIWEMVLQKASEMRGYALIVQGAADPLIEVKRRADELAKAAGNSSVETAILEGANHYFDDRHRELAGCILEWIYKVSRILEDKRREK